MQIEIDLNKTVEENAGIYFNLAKKAKKKLKGAEEAIKKSKKQLEELKKREDKFLEEEAKKIDEKTLWLEKHIILKMLLKGKKA